MKKKILLTILLGTLFTYIIYKQFYHETINIVSLGDSISLGYTPSNVKGYSFNDYLKDAYEQKNSEEYITEFSSESETSETLKLKIQTNYTLKSTNLTIQQAIAKAKILTIALGMDELSSKKEMKTKDIETYLTNMENIIKVVRAHNDSTIFLVSLYPTKKLKHDKVTYINQELKRICTENKINFIDIENTSKQKDYFFDNNSYQLNYKGHRYISELIVKNIQKKEEINKI